MPPPPSCSSSPGTDFRGASQCKGPGGEGSWGGEGVLGTAGGTLEGGETGVSTWQAACLCASQVSASHPQNAGGRTGRYEGPPRRLSPPSCSAAVVEVIQPEGRERVLQASLRTPLPSHPVPSLGRPSLPLASLHSQDPAGEDLQEVTYAELHLETPLGSGDPLPPCAPEASSAQPCVYAVLSLSEGGAGAGCVDSCYSAP